MPEFVLSLAPLDDGAAVSLLRNRGSGGIVTFVGKVRDHARGHAVERLEYDAYPEMARRVFAEIAAEAQDKFAVDGVVVHHRIGALDVGDISVVVAVAAPHRGPAFDACRYVIDQLKLRAPIWKKEHGPDGAVWVDDRP